MKIENEIIYTVDQITKMLGYTSSATVRQMIHRDVIKAKKFADVWMIPESEYHRLKNEGYGGSNR